jgi:hypothetical protein
MGFFTTIGTWFGYVGACVVSADATCRPLLAFLALGAAAAAALALVVIAYRKGAASEQAAFDTELSARGQLREDRMRLSLAAQAAAKAAPRRRIPLAA